MARMTIVAAVGSGVESCTHANATLMTDTWIHAHHRTGAIRGDGASSQSERSAREGRACDRGGDRDGITLLLRTYGTYFM